MNILSINFKKVNLDLLLEDLENKRFDLLSKSDSKELLSRFEKAIASGDFLSARNISISCIHLQIPTFFDFVKRKGIFRYSKYTNGKCLVKDIASEILKNCEKYNLFTSETKYLKSIINYSIVDNFYKAIDKVILMEIRAFEKKYPKNSFIKTLLVFTDYLFLSDYHPEDEGIVSELTGRTKEEISSAVSYLIYFYTDRIKTQNINTQFVSEEFLRSAELPRLIISTCYNLDFREFEISIDHFDYYCILDNNKLIINPPYENFEKAIRLGYIRTDLQKITDQIETYGALSFEKLVDDLNELNFDFFELTNDHNYERYRVKMPEPIFDKLIEKFILPDTLFEEEVIYLALTFKEQLLTFNDLERIKLKENLTLGEFLKIQRVFIIFYMFFTKGIYKKEKVETSILLRSLIPSFTEEDLYHLLQKVFPIEKIENFLNIVCWDSGMDYIFDLQYHPILYFDNYFLIPLSVYTHSNSIRNIYASEYKRDNKALLSNGEIDPLVNSLITSLKKAGIECYSQINIGSTDIDVVAIFDEILFVFECKQSLLPVSTFDLRTTFDYVKKAEKQLDLIIKSFEGGNLIKQIELKTKSKIGKISKIHGAIILSNRLFNGNLFKYAVRNIHEFTNMINNGKIRTDKGEFYLWPEKKLTSHFLTDYLGLENSIYNLLFNSLSKRTLTYDILTPNIEFSTYYLDVKSAVAKMEEFTNTLEQVS